MDDLGAKMNIEPEFLEGMNAQIAAIDEKLDLLTSSVSAMHADLKRLVGRPVLEVYTAWATRKVNESDSALPSEGA